MHSFFSSLAAFAFFRRSFWLQCSFISSLCGFAASSHLSITATRFFFFFSQHSILLSLQVSLCWWVFTVPRSCCLICGWRQLSACAWCWLSGSWFVLRWCSGWLSAPPSLLHPPSTPSGLTEEFVIASSLASSATLGKEVFFFELVMDDVYLFISCLR